MNNNLNNNKMKLMNIIFFRIALNCFSKQIVLLLFSLKRTIHNLVSFKQDKVTFLKEELCNF